MEVIGVRAGIRRTALFVAALSLMATAAFASVEIYQVSGYGATGDTVLFYEGYASGVAKDNQLDIARDGRTVGRAQVVEVGRNWSRARIISTASGQNIRRGDRVMGVFGLSTAATPLTAPSVVDAFTPTRVTTYTAESPYYCRECGREEIERQYSRAHCRDITRANYPYRLDPNDVCWVKVFPVEDMRKRAIRNLQTKDKYLPITENMANRIPTEVRDLESDTIQAAPGSSPTATKVPTCLGDRTYCNTWPGLAPFDANDVWYREITVRNVITRSQASTVAQGVEDKTAEWKVGDLSWQCKECDVVQWCRYGYYFTYQEADQKMEFRVRQTRTEYEYDAPFKYYPGQ